MNVIICLVMSFIGSFFLGSDFFALYTIIYVSIDLYESWQNLQMIKPRYGKDT